jgi:hypothetical protein
MLDPCKTLVLRSCRPSGLSPEQPSAVDTSRLYEKQESADSLLRGMTFLPPSAHGVIDTGGDSAVAASCLRSERDVRGPRTSRGRGEMEDEVFDRCAEEERSTFLWRLAQFTRLGFAYPESVVLAGTGIDLAEARKLVTRGCPIETASRILL